jgi:hypothetical protein
VSLILGSGKTSLAEQLMLTSLPAGARVCSNRIEEAGAKKMKYKKKTFLYILLFSNRPRARACQFISRYFH